MAINTRSPLYLPHTPFLLTLIFCASSDRTSYHYIHRHHTHNRGTSSMCLVGWEGGRRSDSCLLLLVSDLMVDWLGGFVVGEAGGGAYR